MSLTTNTFVRAFIMQVLLLQNVEGISSYIKKIIRIIQNQ